MRPPSQASSATIHAQVDVRLRLAELTGCRVDEGLPADPVSDEPSLHVHATELREAGPARMRGLLAADAVAIHLVTATAPTQHEAMTLLVAAAAAVEGDTGWWVEWGAPTAGMWRAWRADPRPSWLLAVPIVLRPAPEPPPAVTDRLRVHLQPIANRPFPPPSET